MWWYLFLGIIFLILMIVTIYPAYKLTKRNEKVKDLITGETAGFGAWDWFVVYIGHYLLWSLMVIFFVIGGGFIFVYFS